MPPRTKQAWREAAEAALKRLYPGVSAGSIPERVWTEVLASLQGFQDQRAHPNRVALAQTGAFDNLPGRDFSLCVRFGKSKVEQDIFKRDDHGVDCLLIEGGAPQ
jgi:hypothetical protein